MVRQYKEALSCQTTGNNAPSSFDASPGRMFLKMEEFACEKRVSSSNEDRYAGTKRPKDKRPVSFQKLCWHETPTGTTCSPMQEKTSTCTPPRFRMDDLADFQDLDRCAAEVLRRRWSISGVCSQQVIEGGQVCKSSIALMSKRGLHLNHNQAPCYLPGNGHCSPYSSGTVERRSDKNHCRARDVVARNFEEIDKILGESNLIMEQSSSSDLQHKVSDYTKVGKEAQQASKESALGLRQGSHGGINHFKQDMEAREVAAIEAARDYLNMDNGHSSILLSERLLKNPKVCAEEEFVTTCRRVLNPLGGSADSADQARCPSTLNSNKQQEWQTTMLPPFATLESSNGTKICDKLTPATSLVTPTNTSESKWLSTAESDRQWLNKSRHLVSGKANFSSMMGSKGTWKCADEYNFGESQLDSTKSINLDGRLPMSSRNFTMTTRQRPSTVDTQKFSIATKKKAIKRSSKSREMPSIQMPVSHVAGFGQEAGVHDAHLPVSESQSCTGSLIRGSSRGLAGLEDGMKQLSTEELLLALENPRKIRTSLWFSSSKDRRGTSCEGRRTYQLKQYLSPGKCSTCPTATEFESGHASSFAGGLDGNDEESTAHSAILASLEEDHDGAYDRTGALASGSHRRLLKSNAFQRSKVRHSELATQLLSSSAKCRGTKDKDNKSPAWMHSLNVRKPSKCRAMSITHTRLQASTASLIKGTVVVEELEELALRFNPPKDAILGAAVNNNFKERGQEDLECRAATASTSNDNWVFDHYKRRQVGHHFPAPVYAKIVEIRKAGASESKSIVDGAAQIAETSTLSGQAGKQLDSFFAPCSDSYLKHRIHGCNGLLNGISLPKVLTVRDNHCATSCFVTQKDSGFDNQPANESTFSSGLDCLISEVVHEWVEVCSTFSPTLSATSESQDTRVVSPVATCSITDGEGTHCPGVEDGSSQEKRLKIVNGMQASETGRCSANQDLFRKVQESKSLHRDSELVEEVRKNSVAALASVIQPLLAALQEAEIEESIVKEFEADETVRLLLEKLQFYETKIQALKNSRKDNFKNELSAEN